nr:outer membrane beta-barrel protein [Bradyrhizobium sp. 155]
MPLASFGLRTRFSAEALGCGWKRTPEYFDAIWASFLGSHHIPLVASSASNWADLELPVQLPQALWSWSGGYVGGHLGGGYGRTSFSNLYGLPVYGDLVDTPGGQIGYNWQKNSWIFGVELEASGAVSDNTNTCLAACGNFVNANCKAGPDVFATGAGRVGYAFGPQSHALAYIKRGLSGQSNQAEVVNNNEFGVWHRRKPILPKIVSAASSVWASSRRLRLHGPSRWSMTTCISAGRGSIRLRPCSFHPFAILPANTTPPARVTSQRKGRIIILAPSRGRRNGATCCCTRKHSIPCRRSLTQPAGHTAARGTGSAGDASNGIAMQCLMLASSLMSRLTDHRPDGVSGELFGPL